MFLFHNNDRMKIKEYKYTIEFQVIIPYYTGDEEEFYRRLELILRQYGKVEIDDSCTLKRGYILKSDKIIDIECGNIGEYTVNWDGIEEVRMVENSDKFVKVKFPSYNKVF